MSNPGFKCGIIAVVGKPNVGKSTLVNYLVGQKVSIVSNKPQTTRRKILGIMNTDDYQLALVDTPGVHRPHTRLDKTMMESARGALDEADATLIVVDASHHPGDMDRKVAEFLAGDDRPRVICMNKMDQLSAEHVQAFTDAYASLFKTDEWMLTTASRGTNIKDLLEILLRHIPEREPLFDPDEFTDQSSRSLAAEFVREKILIRTRQEVPYATAVLVEGWEAGPALTRIEAVIVVEKSSQRAILVGKGGQSLKAIGQAAREDIEHMIGGQVYLGLHVRVQENWRMNPRLLHELEYEP